MVKATLEQRFWAKVQKTPTCWLWMGARNPRGYGKVGFGPRGQHQTKDAHRLAWEFVNGPIPPGQWVLHRCDVRHCVRPDHLFLGDVVINQADMKAKGRSARGERQGRSKLMVTDVRAIRAASLRGETRVAVAARYGVSPGTITAIMKGKNWSWLK